MLQSATMARSDAPTRERRGGEGSTPTLGREDTPTYQSERLEATPSSTQQQQVEATPSSHPHSTKHRRVSRRATPSLREGAWPGWSVGGAIGGVLWMQVFLFSVSCASAIGDGMIDKLLTIKTCGKPNIQNVMSNVTVSPGQPATFKCQVDMSCIVAYIEWYHEMSNGTEKLIKTASSSGDPHVHVIKQVKDTDSGLYTCIAGNVLGQAQASAYLEVNSAPGSKMTSALAVTLALALSEVILPLLF